MIEIKNSVDELTVGLASHHCTGGTRLETLEENFE